MEFPLENSPKLITFHYHNNLLSIMKYTKLKLKTNEKLKHPAVIPAETVLGSVFYSPDIQRFPAG